MEPYKLWAREWQWGGRKDNGIGRLRSCFFGKLSFISCGNLIRLGGNKTKTGHKTSRYENDLVRKKLKGVKRKH